MIITPMDDSCTVAACAMRALRLYNNGPTTRWLTMLLVQCLVVKSRTRDFVAERTRLNYDPACILGLFWEMVRFGMFLSVAVFLLFES